MFKKSKLIKKLTAILEKEKMLASKSGTSNSIIYYNKIKTTQRALKRISKL